MLGHESEIEQIIPANTVAKFASVVREIFKFSSEIHAVPPKLAEALQLNGWVEFQRVVLESLAIGNEIIDLALGANVQAGLLVELKNAGLNNLEIQRVFVDLIIAAGDTVGQSLNFC